MNRVARDQFFDGIRIQCFTRKCPARKHHQTSKSTYDLFHFLLNGDATRKFSIQTASMNLSENRILQGFAPAAKQAAQRSPYAAKVGQVTG